MSQNLLEIKRTFKQKAIEKQDYISKMYQFHQSLFDYAELMKDTAVDQIEITDGQVLMRMRDTGVWMICAPRDQRIAPIEILNFDAYEHSEMSLIRKLIDRSGTYFDIGANFGWYSLSLASEMPELQVYAFEPVAPTFEFLKKNVEINGFKNISLNPFGFSSREEERVFYFYPEGSGNASMADLSERASVLKIHCVLKRLDDFVKAGNCEVDFIKCDVEGAELFVFQGGQETLKRQMPIVFTEMLRKWTAKFEYHPNDIINLFQKLGYSCFTAADGGLKPFGLMNDETVETNFFFLHSDRHEDLIRRYERPSA